MSKCIKLLKYMLFGFNLLFWAVGCSIIAIGIYFVMYNLYGTLFPDIPSLTTGNVLILFGCFIMVFGFLGCMGAIKENKCLLLTAYSGFSMEPIGYTIIMTQRRVLRLRKKEVEVKPCATKEFIKRILDADETKREFFILLLLILLAEVVLAIVLYVFEKEIEPYVKKQLTTSFEKHKHDNSNSTIWDNIQSGMQCCGINGSNDWDGLIPESCCAETKKCTQENAFKGLSAMRGLILAAYMAAFSARLKDKGCSEAFKIWFENNFLYVGIVTICTSVVEVLGMSFALTLYCHISRSSGSLNTK